MRKLYLFGLLTTAIALPWSTFLLSQGMFFLFYTWLLMPVEGEFAWGKIGQNVVQRSKMFFTNKTALLLSSLFFLHILGLLWSSNIDYGLSDIRVKLPLFVMPFLLFTLPRPTKKETNIILWIYIVAVVLCSFINVYRIAKLPIGIDLRTALLNGSTLTGLTLAFAALLLIYFIKKYKNFLVRIGTFCLFLWVVGMLIYCELMTGVVAFFASLFILSIIYLIRKIKSNKKYIFAGIVIFASFFAGIYYIYSLVNDYYTTEGDPDACLSETTKQGNPYTTRYDVFFVEDGNFVGDYICNKELFSEWEAVSGNKIHQYHDEYFTLVRYLSSKHLKKDAEGVKSLTSSDVDNIKKGIANVNYVNNHGLKSRISKFLFGYEMYKRGFSDSSSEFQRLEYAKASTALIAENPIFGVGTGDVKDTFWNYYNNTETSLAPDNYNYSHNQYLLFCVSLGFVGLSLFLAILILPLFKYENRNFLYLAFFCVITTSMVFDDILEREVGLVFYSFFNILLMNDVNIIGKRQDVC